MPRGRILDEALPLFARAGIDLGAADKARAGRRLIIPIPEHDLRVLIVRDTDVPAYVEHGAAHLGIAGRDVLEEQDRDLYEPLDLGIGRCRMVVAEPEDRPVDENAQVHLRYATKFAEITRRHLQARGTVAEIIKLYGSIEIAPLVGLADRIVDLVSTGETLRQHRLREVETILEVSARICVGRAAAKLHGDRIDDLLSAAARRRSRRAKRRGTSRALEARVAVQDRRPEHLACGHGGRERGPRLRDARAAGDVQCGGRQRVDGEGVLVVHPAHQRLRAGRQERSALLGVRQGPAQRHGSLRERHHRRGDVPDGPVVAQAVHLGVDERRVQEGDGERHRTRGGVRPLENPD